MRRFGCGRVSVHVLGDRRRRLGSRGVASQHGLGVPAVFDAERAGRRMNLVLGVLVFAGAVLAIVLALLGSQALVVGVIVMAGSWLWLALRFLDGKGVRR